MAKQTRLVSWNVNGIRAAYKKGFLDWLEADQPDVLSIQETKLQAHQRTDDMIDPPGAYNTYWSYSQRPGYSSTALFSKTAPESVRTELGVEQYDTDGRSIIAEYPDFTLFAHYFPNGGRGDEWVKYKLEFYDVVLEQLLELKAKGVPLVVTGDFNTAHHSIDLARPKENEKVTGFLPEERAWMDKFVSHGFIDTFRHVHGEVEDRYSWWNMRTRARSRNVGWRIDYFFVSEDLKDAIVDADIHHEVEGSDHCPVSLTLKV